VLTDIMHRKSSSGQDTRIAAAILMAVTLIVVSGHVHEAAAQSARNGSIYSRYGIGELQPNASPQGAAMGGAGLALSSFRYANVSNPASLSDQIFTRLTAAAVFQTVNQTDAAQNETTVATGYLDRVQFSFPLMSRRLGLGFSFAPFSRVGYQVQVREELSAVEGIQESAPYQLRLEGRGGIHRVDAGFGLRVAPFLSVGASANFLWGVIEESQSVVFASLAFDRSRTSFSTQLMGFTSTFAASGSARRILGAEDVLALSATITLPTTLTGDRVAGVGLSLDRDTVRAQVDIETSLPIGIGAGIAYELNPSLTFVLDFRYEPWSEFSSNVQFPGYIPGSDTRFKDRHRIGGGVELLPAGRDLLASYFKRIAYRFGAYQDRTYAAPASESTSSVIALTAGLSLPTRIPGTRIDLNLELGTRGTIDNGLVKDRFFKIGLILNVGERWFQKRKLG
jgi:hypothetical protein